MASGFMDVTSNSTGSEVGLPLMSLNSSMNGGGMNTGAKGGVLAPVQAHRPLPPNLRFTSTAGADFLPNEVIFALTQRPSAEMLGPPTNRQIKGPSKCSNVWNFPKRREKLKHLTESTSCICGAGRDISFLYDVPPPPKDETKPNISDPSLIRLKAKDPKKSDKLEVKLPDSLIPEEFHIVKSKGVMGLEYHEGKFTTEADDHEKHLVIFPSMNPSSRFEVIQLRRTMDALLEKAGLGTDLIIEGPTQMHRLLDLVKKEQDIYNIVFHELIRQTTVECVERGELLAELRHRYNCLLTKVPEEVKSMHNEVVAQRTLDRRLTEELMRFKTTIGVLTSELSEVKEHDKRVTSDALRAQQELKDSLEESKRNTDLLNEYHSLYELQRQRLEVQVTQLNEEKELWSTAAYCLALKVTNECGLTTAKRLHVAEKSWSQVSAHFTLLLSDRDTEALTQLQSFVDQWRDEAGAFTALIYQQEAETGAQLAQLKKRIYQFKEDFKMNYMNVESCIVASPDKEQTESIFRIIIEWEDLLTKEMERFGGDEMLGLQEKLESMKNLTSLWTEGAIKVFSRHRQSNGQTYHEHAAMIEINKTLEELVSQFTVRMTGDNGLAKGIICLLNLLDSWHTRLAATRGAAGKPLLESDWARMFGVLDEWAHLAADAASCIGLTAKDEDKAAGKKHNHLDVTTITKDVQRWMSSTASGIDSEDARLVESVSQMHTSMVHWMVQTLLRLAPDHPGNSEEAHYAALIASSTPSELHHLANALFLNISEFTTYVTQCCSAIVAQIVQTKMDNHEDDADSEANELKRMKTEADEWIVTAKIMLEELDSGEPAIDKFDPLEKTPQQISTSLIEVEPHETSQDTQSHAVSDSDEISPSGLPRIPEATTEDRSEVPEQSDQRPGDIKPSSSEAADFSQVEDSAQAAPADQPKMYGQPAPATSQEEIPPRPDSVIQGIGTDLNTHARSLDQDPDMPEQNKVILEPGVIVDTPDTEMAFQALNAMKQLQTQLQEAEERAQSAEQTAMQMELQYSEAQDRIQFTEKKLETALQEIEALKATIEGMETRPAMLKEDTGVVGKRPAN